MSDLLGSPPLTTRRRGTVLVVDDEEGVRASIRAILEETCEILEAEHGAAALEILAQREVDLVMLDQRMPGEAGVDILPRVKALDPSVVVVIATAVRDIRTAVEALKRGAYDYLIKPFEVDDIIGLADRVLEKRDLEREVVSLRSALAGGNVEAVGFEGLVGRHPEMARLYQLITQIAPTPTTVLITGESGTGKELVARAIHRRSERCNAPFVALNVAAMPETLVESELFGHERGAFTGAVTTRRGLLETAQGGTCFLDEVSELSPALQAKLLRVLQDRVLRRVGGNEPIPVDVRLVAATNRDLRKRVEDGLFREDLYYRLNGVTVAVPALRERGDDVVLLAEHFARKYAAAAAKPVEGFAPGTLDALRVHAWPGNVRELEHAIERAVALARSALLLPEDLPADVRAKNARAPELPPKRMTLGELKRWYVALVLDEAGGNKVRAAELLGIDRRTLYRILERADGPDD